MPDEQPTFRDLLTGLYDRLSHQDQHLEKIENQVIETNSRVDKHDIDLAVIKEAEGQAAIMQAAKIQADALVVAKRLTWRQGIVFGLVGALASGIMLAIIYGSGIA
jgi:uncharacterized coiled-coil protein SlyX